MFPWESESEFFCLPLNGSTVFIGTVGRGEGETYPSEGLFHDSPNFCLLATLMKFDALLPPPMKLWEGSDFSHVCQSVSSDGGTCGLFHLRTSLDPKPSTLLT